MPHQLIEESNQKILQGIEQAKLNTEALMDMYQGANNTEKFNHYLYLFNYLEDIKEGISVIINDQLSSTVVKDTYD